MAQNNVNAAPLNDIPAVAVGDAGGGDAPGGAVQDIVNQGSLAAAELFRPHGGPVVQQVGGGVPARVEEKLNILQDAQVGAGLPDPGLFFAAGGGGNIHRPQQHPQQHPQQPQQPQQPIQPIFYPQQQSQPFGVYNPAVAGPPPPPLVPPRANANIVDNFGDLGDLSNILQAAAFGKNIYDQPDARSDEFDRVAKESAGSGFKVEHFAEKAFSLYLGKWIPPFQNKQAKEGGIMRNTSLTRNKINVRSQGMSEVIVAGIISAGVRAWLKTSPQSRDVESLRTFIAQICFYFCDGAAGVACGGAVAKSKAIHSLGSIVIGSGGTLEDGMKEFVSTIRNSRFAYGYNDYDQQNQNYNYTASGKRGRFSGRGRGRGGGRGKYQGGVGSAAASGGVASNKRPVTLKSPEFYSGGFCRGLAQTGVCDDVDCRFKDECAGCKNGSKHALKDCPLN